MHEITIQETIRIFRLRWKVAENSLSVDDGRKLREKEVHAGVLRLEQRRPGRVLRPMAHRLARPCGGLILMAGSTGIGNFVSVGLGGRDEAERVRVNERARHPFGFNLRHVAGDTLVASAAGFVMGVLFDGTGVGPSRGSWAVAV